MTNYSEKYQLIETEKKKRKKQRKNVEMMELADKNYITDILTVFYYI